MTYTTGTEHSKTEQENTEQGIITNTPTLNEDVLTIEEEQELNTKIATTLIILVCSLAAIIVSIVNMVTM